MRIAITINKLAKNIDIVRTLYKLSGVLACYDYYLLALYRATMFRIDDA